MRTREEQISDLANLFGEEGTFSFVDDLDAATKHILEAERRAEQRVRAECREEISSLRNGLSKCASLTDGFASPECSISFLSEDVPEELRLYVNRIKSEKECDSERLDWLLSRTHYGIPGFDPIVRGRTPEKRKADLIRAIDAAREVG